jgi:hypothetical protein|nr:YbhB/YbcL family Raf kinase inhibitor-like protein [Kofleriaceae bacterium]
MRIQVITTFALAASSLVAYADKHVNPPADLTVTSGMFKDKGAIPTEMTCDGAETPPMLTWSGAPDNTKSFAIEVRDLDNQGGKFAHWIVSGIKKDVTSIGGVPDGAVAGMNAKGDNGWMGPCPPAGATHRYQFTVFALDKNLNSRDYTLDKLDSAVKGHVVASGAIVGTYTRQAKTDLKP